MFTEVYVENSRECTGNLLELIEFTKIGGYKINIQVQHQRGNVMLKKILLIIETKMSGTVESVLWNMHVTLEKNNWYFNRPQLRYIYI